MHTSVARRVGYAAHARLQRGGGTSVRALCSDEWRQYQQQRESQESGRTLAKLALLARAARGAIQQKARERLINPDIQVRLEQEIAESSQIVRSALAGSGSELGADDLADDVDNAPPIALDAVDYKSLLRAEYLRDSLESTMVALNVLPPEAAWVDGSHKRFCRLERRELKRREREAEWEKDDAHEIVAEDDAFERVTPAELAKRKAEMEAASGLGAALQGYSTALLEVRRVHKVHKGGTTLSVRALVAIGDGAGTAGYGEGKSETTAHAVERACRDATRNLLTVQRRDERTIHHRVLGKYVKSRVVLWPAPPGTGVSANNNFTAIFRLFGIKDIGAKLHGPRSLTNAVKALFNALSRVHTPESISAARGVLIEPPPPRQSKRRQISW